MRLLFITSLLFMLTSPVSAHKCVLEGGSTANLQIYNACKADLAAGVAGHDDQAVIEELLELRAENEALKARLTVVKRQLLDLLGDL